MPRYIHKGGLGLLQRNVADQRFISTILGFQVDEYDLRKYGSKALDLQFDRSTNTTRFGFLRCGFQRHDSKLFEFAEFFLSTRAGQYQY
uniref:Uncharacterized protein n=1 Tax=Candidatus Kentrum sp. TC TaxID=2126339 RepID=A0A450YXF8_9GAMM|nr:MAG: hypothetical protein BECKTC1821E_GA0114239_10609 [Candidatus Kentron sp. TC]